MKKFQIIGITGRSGSGKSAVMQYLEKLGYHTAHGDVVAREVVTPGQPALAALAEAFGEGVLNEDGTLRRADLAARAFASPEKNRTLVDITHPAILQRMLRLADDAAAAGEELFFLDGAMIIGNLVEPYCDKIVVVSAPEQEMLQRIMTRDGMGESEAKQRLAAQMSDAEMCEAADYVLHNDGNLEQLQRRTDKLLKILEED